MGRLRIKAQHLIAIQAKPEKPRAVVIERIDGVGALRPICQLFGSHRRSVVGDLAEGEIDAIENALGADPQIVIATRDGRHLITGQGVGDIRLVLIAGKVTTAWRKSIQPSAVTADPENTAPVLPEGRDPIIAQAGWISGVVAFVLDNLLPNRVEAVETVAKGADPEVTALVLTKIVDSTRTLWIENQALGYRVKFV